MLRSLSRVRSARSRRESSYDRTGGNADFVVVPPGASHVLADLEGPGVIRHLWVTALGDDPHLLRTAALRITWEDAPFASVDAPLGDFFGIGFGRSTNFAGLPIARMPEDGRGMNCWWPMPFRRRARVEVVNESEHPIRHLFYHVDWEEVDALDDEEAYFHAWFHRQDPTDGIAEDGLTNHEFQMEGLNRDGAGNYLVLDVRGRGHYVGCVLNVHNLRRTDESNWWGEGDDMFWVDGEARPSLHGTGTEDYFGTAWCPTQAFHAPFSGITLPGESNWKGQASYYRFHLADPVHFHESLRFSIEHGHANRRSDDWSSVAYWYLTEPGLPEMPRLGAAARIPHPPDHPSA